MYKDGNEIFCLSIKETYNNIKQGEYKNPYTNREFNKEFIQRMERIYSIASEQIELNRKR